jgi:hypothetical protein
MQNVLILKIDLERDFAAGVYLPEAQNPIPLTHCICVYRAGIFKESKGARNRGGIGLSYRPTSYIGWRNSVLGIDSWAQYTYTHREGREI